MASLLGVSCHFHLRFPFHILSKSDLFRRKNLVNIEKNDELIVPFTHTPDKFCPELGAYLGGRLYLMRLQFKDSWTESTRAPMMVFSPSKATSTTMMQVSTVFSVRDMSNLSLISRTGTTLPRRLITPRM